jgi:toxin ParE1/3/4
VRIRFIPPARRELLYEAHYYEVELAGLGDAFLDEVARTLALIKAHPEAWPFDEGTATRRVRMARFPFAIIYLINDDDAVVIAIAHTKRRPGYWRKRMSQTMDEET